MLVIGGERVWRVWESGSLGVWESLGVSGSLGGEMATIARFEDIQAWQKARMLVKDVYSTSNSGDFAKDYGLRDQIRRAAVSVMLNIAEGQGDPIDSRLQTPQTNFKSSKAIMGLSKYCKSPAGRLDKLTTPDSKDLRRYEHAGHRG